MADMVSMKDTLRLAVLFGFLAAAAIGGCTGMGEMREGEHGGGEGGEDGEDGEEESRTTLTPKQTYDAVRNGARLMLSYDAEANAFTGTVRNVTEGTLSRVRVEVHLSNGTELGPTTPVDLAPGDTIKVTLQATAEPFTVGPPIRKWVPAARANTGRTVRAAASTVSVAANMTEHGSSGGV